MTFATRSALALIIATLAARFAAAEPDDPFKRARDLYKAGNYAEACELFEKIQKLDPSFGVSFNIAQCDEKIGKLASALKIYRDLAARDTNATRKSASADLAAKLEARVPKIEIHVEPRPAHLVVTLAGTAIPCYPQCTSVPVDFGTYAIVAKAPGYRDATVSAAVSEENHVIVVPVRLDPISLVPGTAPAEKPGAPPTTTPTTGTATIDTTSSRSPRKLIAAVTMVGGGLALGAGIVAGVFARGAWNDAKAICGGSTACATDEDTAKATALGDDAHVRATLSTALTIGGAAILATGVILYLTAPSDEHAVAISARPTDVTLSVRF